MEFLERIERGYLVETWIVRIDGSIATAHVFSDEDSDYNELIALGTARWLGFRHPRVVPLLSVSLTNAPRFVIAAGDERGPSIARAAKQLADANIDREAWAVGETIALCDAITAMAVFDPGFIHRRADPEHIVVGIDGHARFRAPIVHVSVGRIQNYLGRGPGLVTGIAWMSREQVMGHNLTPASDVYQLATTLYTLLTGKRLANGKTELDTLLAIRDRVEPPPIPARTKGLEMVVQRALATDPAARYPDPAAFAAALRAMPTGEPPLVAFDIASRPPHPAPSRSGAIASSRCQMKWTELASTSTEGIRYCTTCRHDVVRVSSALALVPLLGKRCVAFQSDDN